MALGIDLGSFESKMVELVESNDAVQVMVIAARKPGLEIVLLIAPIKPMDVT